MKKEILFSIESLYRDALRVTGYRFGEGKRSACIVGAMRGNEIQQMYIASQLVRRLTELEAEGRLVPGHEILVIPSVNHFSMNLGKRFWSLDNTDVNRMFPGYLLGETTQRIAAKLFDVVSTYELGMQLASFYLPGDFIPHVKIMDLGYQGPDTALAFGLPYVLMRRPRPYDSTTLHYNWQVWETTAFSVYSNSTDQLDEAGAETCVQAMLRFLTHAGILQDTALPSGEETRVIYESSLVAVHAAVSGLFHSFCLPGDHVTAGQTLCEIIHPLEGTIIDRITAPIDGIVFFSHHAPLVKERAVAYRLIADETPSA